MRFGLSVKPRRLSASPSIRYPQRLRRSAVSFKASRKASDEAYRTLVKMVNALALVEGETNYAAFIDYVLTRINVLGAIYLVVVCLLPEFLISATGVPFYFGGTSLLIVVSVTMDTVAQIQGHLLAHQYEGLIKKSKLRGKRR